MSDKKRFRIPRFYKTLMALTVVIGPITWLMLTDDGRRRADLMVLAFTDRPLVEMRLAPLSPAFTEAQMREFLPQMQWQCSDGRSAFGDRSCVAPIGAFNDAPARYLVMYYGDERLQAMKLVYRGDYHAYLIDMLGQVLDAPTDEDGVLRWKTEQGAVLLPARLDETTEEPAMLWLSAEQLAGMPG